MVSHELLRELVMILAKDNPHQKKYLLSMIDVDEEKQTKAFKEMQEQILKDV